MFKVLIAGVLFVLAQPLDAAQRHGQEASWELLPNASSAARHPREPFRKPTREEMGRIKHDDWAIVKFAEGAGVRLREMRLALVESAIRLDRAARYGLNREKLDSQLLLVNEIVGAIGGRVERLLSSTGEESLAVQQNEGEQRIGKELPDLNTFFRVALHGNQDRVLDLLARLNELEIIEYAEPDARIAPPPQDISPMTPDFTSNQGYVGAAPGGIDALWVRALPGGRGESVRVVDVEYGWRADHEDFPPLVSTSGDNWEEDEYLEHGASVVGIIAAPENGYGVSGIAPSVEIAMASPLSGGNVNVADAIQRAYGQSRSGDIILIEQQSYCPAPDLCPVEWRNDIFAVNQTAVANSRIVILAAGNGGLNLDDTSRFGTRFQRNNEDSGAIYVGAGHSSTREPRSFSNYGSRVDLQGWGNDVTTLGCCDLFYPNSDARQAYTATFSGTSSAAPVVTGAAAIIQGIRRGRGLADLTSQQMRTALQVGATPQGAGVHIGPLPDLRDAVAALPLAAPTIAATGSGNGTATVVWSTVQGVSGYELFRRSAHAAAWSLVSSAATSPFVDTGLTPGTSYLYRARSYDTVGTRSGDSNYEIATAITFSDTPLSAATTIRAKHIVEVRIAVNALCTYAGPTICSSAPFSGSALDENYVKTQLVATSHFTAVKSHVQSLRAAIGASAATFGEAPMIGLIIKANHMNDLRAGTK